MRFIAVGDLHMGACPKGVPEELAGKYSGIATWRLLVREAIVQHVDAVLLLGDVVDWSNRFFEALGPLTEGIAELRAQQISVYAVAGNHDFEALESIARVSTYDNFHLLGRGGQWEQRIVTFDGTRIQLFGWSFPARHVHTNPFEHFPYEAVDSTCLRLGLLHADRDVSSSRYAPVRSTDFSASGVEHWLLGHIHKPDALPGDGALYTGSPSGMNVNETGLHGAILLDMGVHPPHYQRVPVSGLRYDDIDLDLGEVQHVGDVQTQLVECARAWAAPILAEQPDIEQLVVTGRCHAVARVSEKTLFDESIHNILHGNEPLPLAEGRQLWFMDVPLEVAPPINPAELVRETGIIGQTARLLRDLDATADTTLLPEDTRALLLRTRQRSREIAARGVFRDVTDDASDSLEETRLLVLQQARRLLTELVARREVQP